MKPINIVIACGGTGGHIVPGIAIAQRLKDKGCAVSFIGHKGGMERKLVEAAGFSIKEISVQKLLRGFSPQNLTVIPLLVGAAFRSAFFLRSGKCDGVVCTGSFVSAPVALAAILLRIPLFFHESNSYPGLTTRWLGRYTSCTFTAFDSSATYLKRAKTLKIGIPLMSKDPLKANVQAEDLGLESDKPVILITGGSQGSQAINRAVSVALPQLVNQGYQIIWQTGQSGYAEFSAAHSQMRGVHIFDFSPALGSYYKLARFAVTRAGALTIAELEENRLPAILIPLPTAAENHQYHNASEQKKHGRALLLEQKDLSPASLISKVSELENNYREMKASLELPPNTAAEDIAKVILDTISREDIHAGKN